MLRLATVNAAITAAGLDLELVQGEGYFYFVGPGTEHVRSASVMVYRLNHLPLDRWLAEAAIVADEIAERTPPAAAPAVIVNCEKGPRAVTVSTSNPPAAQVREAWLAALAVEFMAVIEERCGLTFPPVRVTCGFPSRGGEMGRNTRVRGQCWSADASEDKHAEIFISPVEADVDTVAAILAHELVHAAIPEAGHGKPFQRAMAALGHIAPFTTATPVDLFWEWARPLLIEAGPYPHAMLVAMRPVAAPKKQAARMLKCTCLEDGCGYTVRGARKWLLEVGFPICPKHLLPMVCEGVGEAEDAGDDEGEEG